MLKSGYTKKHGSTKVIDIAVPPQCCIEENPALWCRHAECQTGSG